MQFLVKETPFFKKIKPTPYDEAVSLTWYLENIFYNSISNIQKYIKSNIGDKNFVNHDLIVIKTDTKWTQITLCNYDVFQDDQKKQTQSRHKTDKQKKEGKEMKIKEREKWWEDGYKC